MKIIILGIIQGVTEWLPISSTGHLRLVEQFLNLKVPILFDVILHVGTLLVILVFFRAEVKKMLSAIVHFDFRTEYGRIVPLVVAGTIPTLFIGVVFGRLIEDAFQTTLPIAMALILGGIVLYSTKVSKERTKTMEYLAAIMIGVAQGIAIVPGISRSGMTIAVALMFGVTRRKAFEFSFLLSIPAILGALGLTIYTEAGELGSAGLGWNEVFVGLVFSMLTGYIALKLLWKTIARRKFHLFSFYCWLVGAALIMLQVF